MGDLQMQVEIARKQSRADALETAGRVMTSRSTLSVPPVCSTRPLRTSSTAVPLALVTSN